MKVSIVIPTWNGENLLRKNLPAVLAALPKDTEVIIVDDGSTDGSREYLEGLGRLGKSGGPVSLKIIFNKKNRGFIYSCNRGVKAAGGEFVVLLNNDVVPRKGFLAPALAHFRDEKVFAVSFNEQQYGWAKMFWRGGFVEHKVGGRPKKAHISAWASGGSAIYRKSIWEKLDGFDKLYEPFYWEDFDLGYRAWKDGCKIIWEPKAIVEHCHESTISKLNKNYVSLIKERNRLLFIWKNVNNPWWRLTNIFGIIGRVVKGPGYLRVVWMALKRYWQFGRPKAKEEKITDKEALELFK